MATDQEAPPAVGLISGIVHDAQTLLAQQLTLFQTEIKHDLSRTRDATIPLVVGLAVSLPSVILLCFTLVYALVWFWPALPLFAAFGIVGVVVGLVAGCLLYLGKSKFDAFNPLPVKSVEALKETVQWTAKM
jgi:hypothetical protein